MTEGAERIIQRVLDDAHSKSESIKAEALAKASSIENEARQKAARQQEQILEKARKEAIEQKRRIIGVAQLEVRKELLSAKQELIAESFKKALDELTAMEGKSYQAVIRNLLLNLVESGTETVACSASDLKKIPESFWQEINDALREKGKKGELTLAEEPRDIRGGFVLLSDGVEINCSFEALLEMQRDELEPEVAAVLFK